MIGQPTNRIDGPKKVTGTATYAGEQWTNDIGQPLYGVIVGATIGRGTITSMNTTLAERAPGVRFVLTHKNAPPQAQPDPAVPSLYSRALPVLSRAEVRHYGEPIALVIADTFEQARAGAALVHVEYTPSDGAFDMMASLDQAYAPKAVNAGLPTDTAVGDFDKAFNAAPTKIDVTYTTPYEFSQPMEPHACLAAWKGDDLTVHFSSQVISEALTAISSTLQIDKARIRLLSPYIGGGFGSKLGIHPETILAILGARAVQRPVKVHLTREQVFHVVGVRPATRQRVRIAAGRDGRLVALAHEVTMFTNRHSEYAEQTAATTRSLYAAPNRVTKHRLTPLDLTRGEDVRAPGDAPGLMAVEAAMDELAYALDMDPVELRIINEPKLDPERNVPFSDRRLVECLHEGARRFGWNRRPTRPASRREGRALIGYGMAAAIRMHFQGASKARATMYPDRSVVVQADMTDIGTGTYTILAQVAAETLEVPFEKVRVELGDSAFPATAGSGGSWGAGNTSNAVLRACTALNEKLARVTQIPPDGIVGEGGVDWMQKEPNYKAYSIHSYGAHFAEVEVDADTGEIRLRRMLGVFSAGRILNMKTAHSQLIGGMTFGISAALHEDGIVDTRCGAFVNRDFAQYLVPVNADISSIDAVILDSFDDKANALGVKGLGELGTCGSGAAVANAVFNATGVRVRDYPITIEKLLRGLPPLIEPEADVAQRTERTERRRVT